MIEETATMKDNDDLEIEIAGEPGSRSRARMRKACNLNENFMSRTCHHPGIDLPNTPQ